MTIKILFFVWLCTFFLNSSYAQRQDFSGAWIMVDQQAVSGNLYSNGSPKQITIVQDDSGITIRKANMGANGDVINTTESILFNGKPIQIITSSRRKKIIRLSLDSSQKYFVETGDIYNDIDSARIDFTVTDTWLMDGKRLVLDRKDENFLNGEIWESKTFYEKR